jgi:hypothetical protein
MIEGIYRPFFIFPRITLDNVGDNSFRCFHHKEKKMIEGIYRPFFIFPRITLDNVGDNSFRCFHVLQIFIAEFRNQDLLFHSHPVAVGKTGYHQDDKNRSP